MIDEIEVDAYSTILSLFERCLASGLSCDETEELLNEQVQNALLYAEDRP